MTRHLGRDVFWAVAGAFVVLRLLGVEPWVQSVDAYAYWSTRSGGFYGSGVGVLGAYVYPPIFAQVLAPFVAAPWPLFVSGWTLLNLGTYYWLVGPRFALPLLLFLPVPFEIVSGNVHILIAAAIVLGFRSPVAWAFPLATKLTPGVGLLWFLIKGEWKRLAMALASIATLAAISFALAPDLWARWLEMTYAAGGAPGPTPGPYLNLPLAIRITVAAVLTVLGGLTGRAWLVPIAVTLSYPVVWLNSLATLIAIIPLLGRDRAPEPIAVLASPVVSRT